jgi:hypothetical protein
VAFSRISSRRRSCSDSSFGRPRLRLHAASASDLADAPVMEINGRDRRPTRQGDARRFDSARCEHAPPFPLPRTVTPARPFSVSQIHTKHPPGPAPKRTASFSSIDLSAAAPGEHVPPDRQARAQAALPRGRAPEAGVTATPPIVPLRLQPGGTNDTRVPVLTFHITRAPTSCARDKLPRTFAAFPGEVTAAPFPARRATPSGFACTAGLAAGIDGPDPPVQFTGILFASTPAQVAIDTL